MNAEIISVGTELLFGPGGEHGYFFNVARSFRLWASICCIPLW